MKIFRDIAISPKKITLIMTNPIISFLYLAVLKRVSQKLLTAVLTVSIRQMEDPLLY
ncbi:hypothetical protein DAPPUDRAFT_304972, partial [Daphnia pulex]